MTKKSLYEQIIEIYPELVENEDAFIDLIKLRNDSDGAGDYIAKWEYDKPLPDGLKVGK
jgi:hypothetical protein